MSSLAISAIVFGCIFGSALAAMIARRFLPDHHLNADSRDVVKLGMGLIATLSALVLGLLIATAKGTYDAQSGAINELSASCQLLDRILARYGPETTAARGMLKSNVAATIESIWPPDGHVADLTPRGAAKAAGDALYDEVSQMTPKSEAQRELRARAISVMTEIAQGRLRLLARQDSSIPVPFLVVLVFWLTILFAGYGILAPSNLTVGLALFVCAVSVAGAIFLMLELSNPFSGIIHISSAPMRHAFELLGQ